MKKPNREEIAEWQKDHWRAVALCDLILTAHTEAEENVRLVELRKIKARWGFTLATGYDPNYVRPGRPESSKGVLSNQKRVAEEYVPAQSGLGKSSPSKAPRRVSGTPHGR